MAYLLDALVILVDSSVRRVVWLARDRVYPRELMVAATVGSHFVRLLVGIVHTSVDAK